MIVRDGRPIDPAVIEEVLYRLPCVKLAVIVGCPDAYAGEVPVAYVELTEGMSMTESEILRWLKQNIHDDEAVPQSATVVDKIPVTAVGKIFKPSFRWDAIRKIYQRELAGLEEMATDVNVIVGEDIVNGTSVKLKITAAPGVEKDAIKKRITEILIRYTLYYEIIM